MAGPAAGAVASLGFLLAGLGLSAAGFGGITVQPSAFEDSLLIGLLGEPAAACRVTLADSCMCVWDCYCNKICHRHHQEDVAHMVGWLYVTVSS